MKVTAVRFSRPLLLQTNGNRDEPFYKTIFGFVVKEKRIYIDPDYIKDYVGYLAGLHCISNGDNYFTISSELRGLPDWADKTGQVHIKQDAWLRSVQEKCIKKLNLTYDILTIDLEEDDLNTFINEDNLIVDETFYFDVKKYLSEKEDPLWENDDLPF